MREVLFLSVVLWSCHPDKSKLVGVDELKFHTTDPSEIYFKNVRKSYYKVEELPEAGIEIYHLKSLEGSNLPLDPKIVFNWRNDQARVMFESKRNWTTQFVAFIFEKDGKEEKILVEIENTKAHPALAINIYNAILDQKEIYWVASGRKIPFFESEGEKNGFRITIFDFLRLVEIR